MQNQQQNLSLQENTHGVKHPLIILATELFLPEKGPFDAFFLSSPPSNQLFVVELN